MQTCPCPSCGAEISFQSTLSVSCVCPYCKSLVVRHDVNIEAIGKMAELPEDMTPFQIGTTGKYQRVTFTIIGRTRMAWKDGGWNEWYLWHDNGEYGWLAEAQGFLAISKDGELKNKDLPDNLPPLGSNLVLNNINYEVADIKHAVCLGSEGELPIVAGKGRKLIDIDLISTSGQFATLEYSESSEKPDFYTGEYVEFDDLSFSNLREIPGWTRAGTVSSAAALENMHKKSAAKSSEKP